MQDKNNNFFWPTYVDLLTALFAVVLVLFVLSFKLFKDRQHKLIAQQDTVTSQQAKLNIQQQKIDSQSRKMEVLMEDYRRIQDVNDQIRALEKGGTFQYDPEYKRFLVKEFIGKEIFEAKSAVIKEGYGDIAVKAGKEIQGLISSFSANKNISFLVLIEGNTALKGDGDPQGTVEGNYILSYRRSLALNKLWQDNSITFGNQTEVIISGSGIYGVGRDSTEENNKRFLIQLIPKIKK